MTSRRRPLIGRRRPPVGPTSLPGARVAFVVRVRLFVFPRKVVAEQQTRTEFFCFVFLPGFTGFYWAPVVSCVIDSLLPFRWWWHALMNEHCSFFLCFTARRADCRLFLGGLE